MADFESVFREFKKDVKSKEKDGQKGKLLKEIKPLTVNDLADPSLAENFIEKYPNFSEEITELNHKAVEIINESNISDKIRTKLDITESKTKKAQILGNYLTEKNIIIPVYLDEEKRQRTYYRYIEEKGYWKETSENTAKEMAKNLVESDYTRHFKNEFLNQVRASPQSKIYDSLGLPKNEVLVKNGEVFNLENGSTRNIRKKDYALNMLNVDLEAEEKISEWKNLLEETFENEKEIKTFQEYIGYCLKFPYGKNEKALIIMGESNTGKSTVLKIVRELFKNCEITELGLSEIGHKRKFHIHKLKNSIINLDEDMSSADIDNSSAVKQVISNETLEVEPKGQNSFPVTPKCKLLIASNVSPAPKVKNDTGFFNRFIPLEAPKVVPTEERDKTIVERLSSDQYMKGIFMWAWKGLQRLEENNGKFTYEPDPMEVKEKFDKFGSSVQKFISNCIEKEKGNHVPTRDAYEYYEMWASDKMDNKSSYNEFVNKMTDHSMITKDVVDKHGSRRTCYLNIDISVV